ncbi:glycosyltransferase [Actinomycetospora straminea]|uniref:Glycosyltransferase n=1 Tax=Actinomycetospora straminea TaxID=663607 RepID=A0ABP9EGL4_9PSEU|nr:glycosyltransferase [Actinomycetospora straminea]MDD7935673.1 glycosyltransferase [Actinomycetospora straminea]
MRILFTSYPLFGHVNPMLPLAVAAARAGHEVAFATGADMTAPVERRGLTTWTVGPTHADAVADGRPWFAATAAARAADLVPRAVAWQPDLVVSDEFELAGAVAAAVVGVRHVVHGLGVMIPVPLWAMLQIDPALDELHRSHRTGLDAATTRRATYLEAWPPSLRPAGERLWPRSRPVRPVAGEPAPGERLPAAVNALPHERTVHLTLGTMFHRTPGLLETAIAGLRYLPVNLVVTSGPGTDPASYGPQPPHVLIAPYLPHTLLLPRCSLVVSQGGAGIVLGALAHGLPQVVLPQGADQFVNAEVCVAAGVAAALGPDALTPTAIGEAAGRLLADPSAATRASAVRAEIAAMPDADEVVAALASPAVQASSASPA